MVLQSLLADARNARLADDYGAAIAFCTAYLGAHPGDPEGESLLGLCEIETGIATGAGRIESAATQSPDNFSTQLHLSILREREGRVREAVTAATNAAKKSPDRFEGWAQLGKLLGIGEKWDEALGALEHAAKIRPDHQGVASLLAAAALECGAFERCETTLAVIEQNGKTVQTRKIRAHLARKRGRWLALKDAAREWLEAEPSNEEARLALAHAFGQLGYYDEAFDAYFPLYRPEKPEAHHAAALGRYRVGGRRLNDAERWFKTALKTDPQSAEAAYGLARLLHFQGKVEETARFCRMAIAGDPFHADAFALLAESARGDVEADLVAIDKALARPRVEASSRIALLFAKGDFLHSLKRADEAFDCWAEANAAKVRAATMAGERYDPAAQEDDTRDLTGWFEKIDLKERALNGEFAPIFIVGMPRSGTTLLEAVIAAHPEVNAAGEVPAMPFITRNFLQWARANNWRGGDIPASLLDEWRSVYLAQARRFGAGEAKIFTDKQPSNVFGAGLILRLFPRARIIYLRRNPVETGFSIFRRNFTRQWPFSSNFPSIAHYYSQSARAGEHFLAAAPDRVKFVQYEDFVSNFEDAARDIVAFAGLPWNDKCLTYHEGERAVVTFSASQVKNPPSLKHLNSTAPYLHRLTPLIDALDALGVDRESGARR